MPSVVTQGHELFIAQKNGLKLLEHNDERQMRGCGLGA
jgi:hypothetical protein